ncbi:MAG TPA: apolipoprotein N-acyltransferase, partial [Sulfuricurvum sp.]|nr:apolipoprotein N-acyltransferase [Sulfuricurvum sp.]
MKLRLTHPYNLLILPLLIALGFSAFIYFEHFGLTHHLLNTLLALGSLYGLVHAPRIILPITGFWIGLLWFYWIGYSFQYYDLAWAQWLIALGFGVVYALYFGVLGLTSNPWLRALLLFALTYIYPVDFNWMQPELIFVESYIGLEKWQFALVLAIIASMSWFTQGKKILPLLLLPMTMQLTYPKLPMPPLKIKLISTDISQDLKWQAFILEDTISNNLSLIDEAIEQKYDLIVLPEAAFTLYMNHNPILMKELQQRSRSITILTGTLHE